MAKKETKQTQSTEPDLEAEAEAEQPVELEGGGLRTTDPTFADGAMEVQGDLSYPPQPKEDEEK